MGEILCGHTDAKYAGKGLCRTCYNRQARSTPEGRARQEEYRLKYYHDNKDKARVADIKRRFGLTPEQMEALTGDGRCQICGDTPDVLHIDHDHSCCPGQKTCGNCIRGALCGRCNRALGLFRDDPKFLQAALAYLEVYT